MTPSIVILGVYLGLLGALSLHGLHRLWMLWAFRRRTAHVDPPALPSPPPRVTVQLPMFNERYVAERLLRQVARLDWPADRLQIQVVDDSTDDTTERVRTVAAELREQGLDVSVEHRENRQGFKAGALEEATANATGDFIAIFDADFVPEPSFLKDMMPWFGADISMVQARWGHLNRTHSWLTEAEATLLDGHFLIEHTARHATGRWFNFNGTAGIWRRVAIGAGGGWEHDTLTEDLDLSYRVQLTGRRFRYMHDVVAPAELPPTMSAFKSQQHRWAKGSIQTAKKLLPRIWASSSPLHTKLEATLHLTANLSYPLVVVLSALMPFAVHARLNGAPRSLLWLDAVLFCFAAGPFALFYGTAILKSGSDHRLGRLARLPIALALGIGMALSQTRAVLEGFFGDVGTFARTPKFGDAASVVYRAATRGQVALELLFAVYLTGAFVWAAQQQAYTSLPFMALFAGGYAVVALGTLRD